ncbi:MAG: sensor histidine kinase [Candidatus Thorarchaeota archaeon]|jgi:signal transduction histidine kinase
MQSQGDQKGNLMKIKSILIDPHPTVTGSGKRQQIEILSTILLLTIPILAATAFTSDLVQNTAMTFPAVIIFVFMLYLITRTRFYNISLIMTIAGFTILPLLIWFFGTSWTANDIPRLMVWIFVATIVGALLTRTYVVLIQGIVIVSTMIIVIGGIFQIPFNNYDSHLGTAIVITLFVTVTSYMLETYLIQIDRRSEDLYQEQKELEVYTQLLRHDLRNDIQAIIRTIEIAELLIDVNLEDVKEHLDLSLRLGDRMIQLLQVFSMPLERPGTNLVEMIEGVAKESHQAYSNLKIEISSSIESQGTTFTASRLLPMVWTNIFRNAAQHAGKHPVVDVEITMIDGVYQIQFKDNGPGIPEYMKKQLFNRCAGSKSGESGLGLYLSRVVLESHGGSIELLNNDDEDEGTSLLVRLPTSDSRID